MAGSGASQRAFVHLDQVLIPFMDYALCQTILLYDRYHGELKLGVKRQTTGIATASSKATLQYEYFVHRYHNPPRPVHVPDLVEEPTNSCGAWEFV